MFAQALLTIVLLFAASVYLYLRWYFGYWRKRGVRGPRPEILYGTFPKTSAGKCNLVEELHEIYLHFKSSERFVGVFSGRVPKLFIIDPQLAAQVLTINFKNFHDNESSKWTSAHTEQLRLCSPFVCIGQTWKEKRSELVPALTTIRLRSMYPAMVKVAAKLTQFLKIQSIPVNAKEISNRFTAELVADFIWGVEAGAFQEKQFCVIHEMANRMASQAIKSVRFYGQTEPWPFMRKLKTVRHFPESSDRFFRQLSSDAMVLRSKNTSRSDVISHLMQLKEKKNLSEIEVTGHTTTVLLDGFETGAILIADCMLLLARYPRVQMKLREELLAAGDMTFDRLTDLPYLDQCIQETLRIFPPLPTLFKLCTEATSLTNTDGSAVQLNAGDVVYISSYSFHKDADYFENPEEFLPERFDANFGGVQIYRDMGVFLPFGDGPRMCLGIKLGLIETKVAISEVVRHFNISVGPETRTDNRVAADSFLLTADGAIELGFEQI